jgi:uncharacterized protein
MIGEVLVVVLCLAVGGVLKGATGAGAPILAVPALTAMFDVRFAIVVLCMPNLLTNAWQAWRFREHLPPGPFTAFLVGGGIVGVCLGTWVLSIVPVDKLSFLVALAVGFYVVMRLAKPHWKIEMAQASRLALPVGLAAGFLQGTAGLSAPISLTFLNAVRPERPTFVAVISLLFTAFGAVQTVALSASGLISRTDFAYSILALAPIWAAMPLGVFLAKRLSPAAFDRFILVILSALALKLLIDAAL